MVVEISIFRGTWSEVVLVREERTVPGSISSQARLMNTLSSRSRVGELRLLDQVKLLSRRGNSMRHRRGNSTRHISLMQSLNASASDIRKLGLFFS